MPETEKNNFYPIFVDLTGKNILIIGAGKVALRKLEGLVGCNAFIKVIAPTILPEIETIARTNKNIVMEKRPFKTEDLSIQPYFLIYCATSSPEVNKLIAQQAKELKILINNCDGKHLSSFIVPSKLQRGDLQVAISSGGTSPLFAKLLRLEFEKILQNIDEDYTQFLEQSRYSLQQTIYDATQRADISQKILADDTLYKIWKTTGQLSQDVLEDFIRTSTERI